MSFGYPRYGGRRHNVLADILGGLLQGGTNFLQARQQATQQQRTQKQEDEDRAYQKQYHDLQMQQIQEAARQQKLAPGLGEFQTLRQQYPSPEAQVALSHQQSQYQTGGYTGEPGAGLDLGKTAQQLADEEEARKSQNALYGRQLMEGPENPELVGQAYQGTLPGGAGVPFKPQMLAGLLSGLPGLSTPVPTGAAVPTGQRYTPGEVLRAGGPTLKERDFNLTLEARKKTEADKAAALAERDRMRNLEKQGTEEQKAVAKQYGQTFQDTLRYTGDEARARDAARYAADALATQLHQGGAAAPGGAPGFATPGMPAIPSRPAGAGGLFRTFGPGPTPGAGASPEEVAQYFARQQPQDAGTAPPPTFVTPQMSQVGKNQATTDYTRAKTGQLPELLQIRRQLADASTKRAETGRDAQRELKRHYGVMEKIGQQNANSGTAQASAATANARVGGWLKQVQGENAQYKTAMDSWQQAGKLPQAVRSDVDGLQKRIDILSADIGTKTTNGDYAAVIGVHGKKGKADQKGLADELQDLIDQRDALLKPYKEQAGQRGVAPRAPQRLGAPGVGTSAPTSDRERYIQHMVAGGASRQQAEHYADKRGLK